MQLTGRANYQHFADVSGVKVDKVFLASLEQMPGATKSAARFWEAANCNAPADSGDMEQSAAPSTAEASGWPR